MGEAVLSLEAKRVITHSRLSVLSPHSSHETFLFLAVILQFIGLIMVSGTDPCLVSVYVCVSIDFILP